MSIVLVLILSLIWHLIMKAQIRLKFMKAMSNYFVFTIPEVRRDRIWIESNQYQAVGFDPGRFFLKIQF